MIKLILIKIKAKRVVDLLENTPRTVAAEQPNMMMNVDKEDTKARKTSGLNKKSGAVQKKNSIPDLNAGSVVNKFTCFIIQYKF